eukprot:CAMPEP_0170327188 /NCGR_PEP_ID=MMETSP0116_2-20130129/64478_1 /TAXON_ID=400756 /ORGANISM="Durinskia baltica, Strain CSIRO CS-38" /LENGTH=513 /DNA_ID=CAMNT_0010580259 /DNA_START=29 /DNA_END=1570 /DNA_ORIENTATION=+
MAATAAPPSAVPMVIEDAFLANLAPPPAWDADVECGAEQKAWPTNSPSFGVGRFVCGASPLHATIRQQSSDSEDEGKADFGSVRTLELTELPGGGVQGAKVKKRIGLVAIVAVLLCACVGWRRLSDKPASASMKPQALVVKDQREQVPPRSAQLVSFISPADALNRSVAAVDSTLDQTLYCFAVVKKDSAEPWLMRAQLVRNTGIFGCSESTLFSDVPMKLDGGEGGRMYTTVAIPGEEAWKGNVPGISETVWHNTAVFLRAYRWIREQGVHKRHHWTVKVDPDTVFLPGSLQRELVGHFAGPDYWGEGFMQHFDPETPQYVVNCRQWYSFQGPLEVISRAAAKQFFEGIDQCEQTLSWKSWGEDWFAGHCLDQVGAQKREGFQFLNDMYCASPVNEQGQTYLEVYKQKGPTCTDGKVAFHPYKTVDELVECLEQAAKKNDFDPVMRALAWDSALDAPKRSADPTAQATSAAGARVENLGKQAPLEGHTAPPSIAPVEIEPHTGARPNMTMKL